MQENSETTRNTSDKSKNPGSETGTATGLAGSDVLAEKMNPDVAVTGTSDPSDTVEVTPDELANKNAPGSRTLVTKRRSSQSAQPTVRHVDKHDDDTSTGESGASGGIDAAGPSDGSGGTASTAGSAGSDLGASP